MSNNTSASEINGEILQAAHKLINGERQAEYGPPQASFKATAKLWSAYLEKEISSSQVACCMVLLKLVREQGGHKPDNFLDAAGYIGLACDLAVAEAEATKPENCIKSNNRAFNQEFLEKFTTRK